MFVFCFCFCFCLIRSKCRRPDYAVQELFPSTITIQISSSALLPFSHLTLATPTSHLRTFLTAVYSSSNTFPFDVCTSNTLTTFKQLLKCYLLSYIHCLFNKYTWISNKYVKFNMFNMRRLLTILIKISVSPPSILLACFICFGGYLSWSITVYICFL